MKPFLAPNRKKLLLFSFLYFFIPYPLWFFHIPLDIAFSIKSHFLELWSPFILFQTIKDLLTIIEWMDFIRDPLTFIITCIAPLIYPFIVYFIACKIIADREKNQGRNKLN
jgi:hypothetical protein